MLWFLQPLHESPVACLSRGHKICFAWAFMRIVALLVVYTSPSASSFVLSRPPLQRTLIVMTPKPERSQLSAKQLDSNNSKYFPLFRAPSSTIQESTATSPWLRRIVTIVLSTLTLLLSVPRHALAITTRSLPPKRTFVRLILLTWIIYSVLHAIRVKQRQRLDATSEWARYARHPSARAGALFGLILQMIPYSIAAILLPPAEKQKVHSASGKLFAQGLLQLGPLYIKLGQIFSRRDAMPEEWKKAFERLQDQVPSRTGAAALELAHAAWPAGADDWEATFTNFDTTPIAAASLGQVHTAVLARTNTTVAIKLQRPYLREIYDQDFVFLTQIAATVDRFGGSAGQVGGVSQSWVDIFNDAEEILYSEIDYNDEAQHTIRFCDDFGLSCSGKPANGSKAKSRDGKPLPSAASWLRAPTVYRDLSSEKVLVMEYVPSIKITDTEKLAEANVTQEQKEYLADMLARAYLRQFCSNLFFSTDPHPGNLGVEIKNPSATTPEARVRLVFYDFGQATGLNQNQADGILDVIEAIVDTDVERSVGAFQKMGVLKDNADLQLVRDKVADNYRVSNDNYRTIIVSNTAFQ